MPKGKKKGKGDKKKDGGKEAQDKPQEKKEYEVPPPSQKEILLKKEYVNLSIASLIIVVNRLKELDGELYSLKKQVDQLYLRNKEGMSECDYIPVYYIVSVWVCTCMLLLNDKSEK